MGEELDPRAVIAEAEQAAEAADYARAEDLLREAAALQERRLGPLDPELANTFNNLGVVCELTGKPVDAEVFYRKAYAIATAALPADHAFVATSRKNLTDFCEARGRSIEDPPPEVAEQIATQPIAPNLVEFKPERERRAETPVETHSEPRAAPLPPVGARSNRPLVIAALIVGAIALVMLAAGRGWFGGDEKAGAATTPAPSSTPPPAPTSAPSPAPKSAPAAGPARKNATPPPVSPPAAPSPQPFPKAGGPALVVIVAEVCQTLSTGAGEWQCERPSQPVSARQMTFYTRIKSARDVALEHRWYRGDELRRAVPIQITANPGAGYRTYSRYTVDSPGEWRVELRAGGTILAEDRFTVR